MIMGKLGLKDFKYFRTCQELLLASKTHYDINIKKKEQYYLTEEKIIKNEINWSQNILLRELLWECGIGLSSFHLLRNKKYLLAADIVKAQKLIPYVTPEYVLNNCLSHMEPFPFDKSLHDELCKKQTHLSIQKIRDLIEVQYLAWKLRCDLMEVSKAMMFLTNFVFFGRSLNNIKKVFPFLRECNNKNLSIRDKIYFLNIIPFKASSVCNFSNRFANKYWSEILMKNPKFYNIPHPFKCLYVEILISKGFTYKQIFSGMDYLAIGVKDLFLSLNYLLNCPLVRASGNEDFLKLLYFPAQNLHYLIEVNNKTFDELLTLTKLGGQTRGLSFKKFSYHVKTFLDVDEEDLLKLKNHPMFSFVCETNIISTINNLRIRFSRDEIVEALPIILYNWSDVRVCLSKVKAESPNLEKFGFIAGVLKDHKESLFSTSTCRNKTLHLCLYYLMQQ